MPSRLLHPGSAEIGKALDGEQRPARTPSLLDGLQGGEGPRVFAGAQQRFERHHDVPVPDQLRFCLKQLEDRIGTLRCLAPISPGDRHLGQIDIQAGILRISSQALTNDFLRLAIIAPVAARAYQVAIDRGVRSTTFFIKHGLP